MRLAASGQEGLGFEARLRAVAVSKAAMNRLVMDYLVIEGRARSAALFRAESGTEPGIDLETIANRRAVRAAVERGDITTAVERAGRHLLDGNAELHFYVLQQQLIELIRADRVADAVAFAQEQLSPLAEQDSALLAELERTMLLLAYDDPRACPEAELLGQAQRQHTASLLNAAVLTSQAQDKDAALPLVLRRLQWAQDELRLRHVRFPSCDVLSSALCPPSATDDEPMPDLPPDDLSQLHEAGEAR